MKHHIPNLLTSINLLIGSLGCFIVVHHPTLAIFFVIAAGVFDFLDGLSARLLDAQSAMGKQLDSLADMVSFGVLPALAIFSLITGPVRDPDFLMSLPLLVVPFSAWRLARFNISGTATEFRGLPTPANAIMLTAFVNQEGSFFTSPAMLITISLMGCLLMVSNLRLLALKFSKWSWSGNELKFILILILVAGFSLFGWSMLPFVVPTYIFLSFIGYYLIEPFVKQRQS